MQRNISQLTLSFSGPLNDGEFLPVIVQSIHRNKAPCRVVRASQSASLGLSPEISGLRNGMVLLSTDDEPVGCYFFQVSKGILRVKFLAGMWSISS